MKKALAVKNSEYLEKNGNLKECEFFLLSRPECETDVEYRQLIPYILIQNPINGKYLVYRRGQAGNEGRLHNLYSLGIGGHVEDVATSDTIFSVLAENAVREIEEEIGYPCTLNEEEEIEDLIYNVTNHIVLTDSEVNRVHLAIPFVFCLDEKGLSFLREEVGVIEESMWMCPKAILEQGLELEPWSKVCLDHLLSLQAQSAD